MVEPREFVTLSPPPDHCFEFPSFTPQHSRARQSGTQDRTTTESSAKDGQQMEMNLNAEVHRIKPHTHPTDTSVSDLYLELFVIAL